MAAKKASAGRRVVTKEAKRKKAGAEGSGEPAMKVAVKGRLISRHHVLRVHEVLNLPMRIKVAQVRDGFDVAVVDRLSERLHTAPTKTLQLLGVPRNTFARRREAGRLNADESDRVYRFAELFAAAVELMGNEEAAARWLKKPALAFDGETPLEHASTEVGARDVLQLIGRLEHGIPT